jgi:hypothetical protein
LATHAAGGTTSTHAAGTATESAGTTSTHAAGTATESAGNTLLGDLLREVRGIRKGMDGLKEDVKSLKEDNKSLKEGFKSLNGRVNGIKHDIKEILIFQGATFEASGNAKGVHLLRYQGRGLVLPGAQAKHFRVGGDLSTIRPFIDSIPESHKRENAWDKAKAMWSQNVYNVTGKESPIKDFKSDSCASSVPVFLPSKAGHVRQFVNFSGEWKRSASLENYSQATYQCLFFPTLLTWLLNGIVEQEQQMMWIAAAVFWPKSQEQKLVDILKEDGKPFDAIEKAAQRSSKILKESQMLQPGEVHAEKRLSNMEDIILSELRDLTLRPTLTLEEIDIPDAVFDKDDVKKFFQPYTAVNKVVAKGDDKIVAKGKQKVVVEGDDKIVAKGDNKIVVEGNKVVIQRAKAAVGLLASLKVLRALKGVTLHFQGVHVNDVLEEFESL